MQSTQRQGLILASTSPRRRQLLAEAGYAFEVVAPRFEEPDDPLPHVSPMMHVESLAYFKARSVAGEYFQQTILAADTLAFYDNTLIGKPSEADDARAILTRLAGTSHQVITGVALLAPASGRRLLQHEVSIIHMRPLTSRQIDDYIETGEWRGKAGAYGIQDHGDEFVERYEGSFSNIVGLPMELVGRMLSNWVA